MGGRTDKGDGAVFDVWQKSILLAFIEPVYLINKQDGATASTTVLQGMLDRIADFFNAGSDSGLPAANRCCRPIYCTNVVGRMRAANGWNSFWEKSSDRLLTDALLTLLVQRHPMW